MTPQEPIPQAPPFLYDDGGRSKYFQAAEVGDCVPRAIAIATGIDYKVVYEQLQARQKGFSGGRSREALRARGKSVRNGTAKTPTMSYLTELGWIWEPLCRVGDPKRVHVRKFELPGNGRFVLSLSRHLTALIDGTIHDTYDPSREGTRMIYGYWAVEGSFFEV